MAISGVGQSYYQNNVATTKSTKSVNSTGETGNTKELSEAEEMAIFKKEFYAEIDKIPRNRTITNVAINISEEAFKNMKDDPEYREKILSALKRDLTSSFAPLEASMVLTVGATAKDYRGDSWSGVIEDYMLRVFNANRKWQNKAKKEKAEKNMPKQAESADKFWVACMEYFERYKKSVTPTYVREMSCTIIDGEVDHEPEMLKGISWYIDDAYSLESFEEMYKDIEGYYLNYTEHRKEARKKFDELMEILRDGEAMVGINEQEIELLMAERGK